MLEEIKEFFMRSKDMDSPSQFGGMRCPNCGSDNLNWSGDNSGDDDEFMFFESTGWCPDCGSQILWTHDWALESKESIPVSDRKVGFDW